MSEYKEDRCRVCDKEGEVFGYGIAYNSSYTSYYYYAITIPIMKHRVVKFVFLCNECYMRTEK